MARGRMTATRLSMIAACLAQVVFPACISSSSESSRMPRFNVGMSRPPLDGIGSTGRRGLAMHLVARSLADLNERQLLQVEGARWVVDADALAQSIDESAPGSVSTFAGFTYQLEPAEGARIVAACPPTDDEWREACRCYSQLWAALSVSADSGARCAMVAYFSAGSRSAAFVRVVLIARDIGGKTSDVEVRCTSATLLTEVELVTCLGS